MAQIAGRQRHQRMEPEVGNFVDERRIILVTSGDYDLGRLFADFLEKAVWPFVQ